MMRYTDVCDALDRSNNKLDQLRQIAREMSKQLRKDHTLSPEAAGWIKEQEQEERQAAQREAERKAEEETKRQALAKLSPAEREALGL